MRPLSIALSGDNVVAMWKTLRGEGHPFLWYFLLRLAHDIVPRPEILLGVSLVVAAAAMVIVLWRGPFIVPVTALILFSEFSAYEYSVSARNYGISVLLFFLFAVAYDRRRDSEYLPGLLLALIANCSAPAAVAACGPLVLWYTDIVLGPAAERTEQMRIFQRNCALFLAGLAFAFLTVYPTYNEAAVNEGASITPRGIARAVLFPGNQFVNLFAGRRADLIVRAAPAVKLPLLLLQSLLMFGSVLGLIRRPGAVLAGLSVLIMLSVFYTFVYPGSYRHQAQWIALMICLYWIAAPKNSAEPPGLPGWLTPLVKPLSLAGMLCFLTLLALQLPPSAARFMHEALHPALALRQRENTIRPILARAPGLTQATILADPDYLLDTLSYYVSNPLWLTREQRYGNVTHLRRRSYRRIDLGNLLADARMIKEQTHRPVVILLSRKPEADKPESYCEVYGWTFTVTPDQARDFENSTILLGQRPVPPDSDEGYYVWTLK